MNKNKQILSMLFFCVALQSSCVTNKNVGSLTSEKDTLQQDKFQIGIFYGPPWAMTNDKQYQAIEDAHVDYIQYVPVEATEKKNLRILDLAERHQLGIYVNDGRIRGSDADIRAMIDVYKSHRATFGYFIVDEPGIEGLDWTAKTYRLVLSLDPNRIPSVNLLPGWAVKGYQKDYVEKWISKVGKENLVYLSFDNYPFMIDGTLRETYYQNLDIIRRVALKNNIKTSCYLQSVGIKGAYRRPNENELRFSAYTTIAYGIKNIVWFTYCTPTHQPTEVFTNAIIDSMGNKTNLYEPFKRINSQLKHLGRVLAHLDAVEVYHFDDGDTTGSAGIRRLPDHFFWQPISKSDKMIITYFINNLNGDKYIMVVNESLKEERRFTFHLLNPIKEIYQVSKISDTKLRTNYNRKKRILSDLFLPGEGKLYKLN